VTETETTAENAARRGHDGHESDFQGALLAMAGHDLRQPLQVISSTFGWLARHFTHPSELTCIRRGEAAIATLTEQLDHLIDALRLHERAAMIAPEPVALGPPAEVRIWRGKGI
jgi:hypothetical protein